MNLQRQKQVLFKIIFSLLRFLNRAVTKFRTRPSNSILIIQLHFIGDTILVTPALTLLKKSMSQYRLHIFVSRKAVSLVANNQHIDKVFADRTDHTSVNSPLLFLRKITANLGVILSMWKENYDYVIDYSGYFDTSFISNIIGGKNIIGMSVQPALMYAYDYFYYIDSKDRKRLGSNYLDLLSYFKISYTKNDCGYQIFLTKSDMATADQIMLNANDVKIALAPFAGWTSKEWPLDRFIALSNQLAEMPATIYILGDTQNKRALEPYTNQICDSIINCTGKTSLTESSALISKCDLFIGVDSAMSYAAAAFGIPSVLIFGSTNPAFHWDKSPGKLVILYNEQACSCKSDQLCCGDNTIIYQCPYNNRCMRAISVEEVYSSIQKLLKQER